VHEDDLDDSLYEEVPDHIPTLVCVFDNEVQQVRDNISHFVDGIRPLDAEREEVPNEATVQLFRCQKCNKKYKKESFFKKHEASCEWI